MRSNGSQPADRPRKLGIPEDDAINLFSAAVAEAIRDECQRTLRPERDVINDAGLPEHFLEDAADSAYEPTIRQIRLAARALSISPRHLYNAVEAIVATWVSDARPSRGTSQGEPALDLAQIGTFLVNPQRRRLLLLAAAVPRFDASDLADVFDDLRQETVEEALDALIRTGAVTTTPGPGGRRLYAVERRLRKTILGMVRDGLVGFPNEPGSRQAD